MPAPGDGAGAVGIGFEHDGEVRRQQRLGAYVCAVISRRPGRDEEGVKARGTLRRELRHFQAERTEDALPGQQRCGGGVQGVEVAAHRGQRLAEVPPGRGG